MENNFNIKPKEIITTTTITKITITTHNIIINSSINLLVTYYDDKDKYVETIHLVLDGEDYKNYKDSKSDDYLLNWICNKLNLTIQQ
jgi:hypothetical protein